LLNEFAQYYPDTLNIVVMDNGSCHKAKSLSIPENIVCLFFPPYSPELNPIERLWQDVKDQGSWALLVNAR
jgi:transposase